MIASHSVAISCIYLASGLFFFFLGLTILRIGGSNAPSRAAAMMLFFAGIGPLLSATGLLLESNLTGGSVLYRDMLESFEYLWAFFFPSLMMFALSFPRESRWIREYPFVGFILFLPYLFHLVVMMHGDQMLGFVAHLGKALPGGRDISVGSREIAVGTVDNLLNVAVRILERVHRNAFAVVNIVYAASSLVLLNRNRRRAVAPRVAEQTGTLVFGLTVALVVYTITRAAMMFDPHVIPWNVSSALINGSLVVSGGTIAYAVIRQQFLGIRNIMRRAALYAALAGLFALAYMVVVRPIGDYFGRYSAASRDVFEAGFILLAVITFQPVLLRAEELLGRIFLKGERAGSAMRQRGDAVAAVTSRAQLERVLDVQLRASLDASAVKLVTAEGLPWETPFFKLLSHIGEPVSRADLLRLAPGHKTRRRPAWGRLLRRTAAYPGSDVEKLARELRPYLQNGALAVWEVFVPVTRNSVCEGFVGLGPRVYGVDYEASDIGVLSALSAQLGSALEKIGLIKESLDRQVFEEELKIDRRIQTQLLPGAPPALNGYELSAVTIPSRYVGGDYYDFVFIDEHYLAIVVADVSGKGIPASILTASLQATVRSNADVQAEPGMMLDRLNRLMHRNTSSEEFATLFYAVVDLRTGCLRYANAGHEFPFIACNGNTAPLAESGLVLGCLEHFPYETCEGEIPRDGALVVYTDGVTDSTATDGSFFGTERLRTAIRNNSRSSAEKMCGAVARAVREFGSSDPQDDYTLVVLKRCA